MFFLYKYDTPNYICKQYQNRRKNMKKLGIPVSLGLMQAAALAAKQESTGIAGQLVNGFKAIPAGGLGLILAVVLIFVVGIVVGFYLGTR